MALYEEPDKPSDALAFVRNNFAATELHSLKAQMENMTQENEQLKTMVASLEKDKAELQGKVQNLENLQKQNDATAVESPKSEEVEKKEVQAEPMEEPKEESKTSEVAAESGTETQNDAQVIFEWPKDFSASSNSWFLAIFWKIFRFSTFCSRKFSSLVLFVQENFSFSHFFKIVQARPYFK